MSVVCPKHDTGGGPCYCPSSIVEIEKDGLRRMANSINKLFPDRQNPRSDSPSCITHHHACDCREHKVAVLIKAAQDAAVELDELKNTALNSEEIDRAEPIVARLYSACEALGADLEKHEVAA